MASTNKTTHYELSQYIGTDKPTYLIDYNQDMSKIDTGIYAAKSEADNNATSIGTLSSLTTTTKTDLVSALNEVDSDVATNTNNIATNTSNIATNTTHIGTVANLSTTAKTDLVVASNEINAKVGNLSNLTTTAKSSLVLATNEVNSKTDDLISKLNINTFNSTTGSVPSGYSLEGSTIKVAKNSDGSLFKVYGDAVVTAGAWSEGYDITLTNTGLPSIDEAYTINAAVTVFASGGSSTLYATDLVYNTNGSLTIKGKGFGNNTTQRFVLSPCLYFNANFGDTSE